MNSDKYKLKKTLREETTLPPELSWLNMEKGILDRMDQQTEKPTPATSNKFWLSWTLFATALFVTAIVAFYLGNRAVKTGETHPLLNVRPSLPHTAHDLQSSSSFEKPQTSSQATNAQNLIDKSASHPNQSQLENEAVNTKVNYVDVHRSVQHAMSGGSATAEDSPNNKAIKSIDNTKITSANPIGILQSTAEAANSASVLTPSLTNNTQNIFAQENPTVVQDREAEVINLLSTLSCKLKSSNAESIIGLGWVSNAPTRIQKTKSNFIGIGSGITFLNPQFTSVAAGEKFTSLESSVLSQSFFFHYGRLLGKNWQVTGGLEYSKYWHRFDFVKETISQKSINNVPVVIHVNAISHDSTFIYGDTIATVKNIRTIRHYNHIEVVSVPLMVSYQKKWNNWSAFSSLGATLQWNNNAAGKTLMADKLIEYGDTTAIHKNFLGLSMRLEGGLAYTFHENISLTGSIWVNQSLSNWSSVAGTNFKPWSVGSNLGLRYRF